jgi:heme-degrading monooxygenase HmoA
MLKMDSNNISNQILRKRAVYQLHKRISGHSLQKCIEQDNKYILLVNWEHIEDHTIGFRQSAVYQQWKELLHHYYDPFPVVEHYEMVLLNK